MNAKIGPDEELDNVTKGIIISMAVLVVDFAAGLLFTAAGYEWAMDRAAVFAGMYITAAGALWVGYILYDLWRTLRSEREMQSTLSDWNRPNDDVPGDGDSK